MSIHEVEKFYIRIETDENLQNQLMEIDKTEPYKVKTAFDATRLIKNKIIPIAQNLGYEFTAEELLFYETKILKLKYKRIAETDLSDISGGNQKQEKITSLSDLMKCLLLDDIDKQNSFNPKNFSNDKKIK